MDNQNPRKRLDVAEKKREFVRLLESNGNAVMVLATSCDDQVLARNVLVVTHELNLYFFTWRHSRKCAQIQKNPRVALCKDNVQMEGVAEIVGDLAAEETRKFTDLFREKFPDAIKKWERRPSMIIVRVRPTFAAIGGNDDPPSLDFLDLAHGTAFTEPWACY